MFRRPRAGARNGGDDWFKSADLTLDAALLGYLLVDEDGLDASATIDRYPEEPTERTLTVGAPRG